MALLRSGLLFVVLVIGWSWVRMEAPHAQQTLEDEVKAAFLYNFTKYVDWPTAAFSGQSDPFRLCVLSDSEFAQAVQSIVVGETARGRALQLVRPDSAAWPTCHILFVGQSHAERAGAILSAVSGRPILTVGETPKFLDQGGAVLFVVEQNRVRFDIDLRSAGRAGLTVSSKLLRVARRVREGEQ